MSSVVHIDYVRADIHEAVKAERDEAVRKCQAMSVELTEALATVEHVRSQLRGEQIARLRTLISELLERDQWLKAMKVMEMVERLEERSPTRAFFVKHYAICGPDPWIYDGPFETFALAEQHWNATRGHARVGGIVTKCDHCGQYAPVGGADATPVAPCR